jgi:hypothetical protein
MVKRRKKSNAARKGFPASQRPDRPRSTSQADNRCFQAALLQGQFFYQCYMSFMAVSPLDYV